MRDLLTYFLRSCSGVHFQVAYFFVHECYGKNYRFFGFSCLKFEPTRRLGSGAIFEGPVEASFAVWSVAGWAFTDEGSEVVYETVAWGEATHA